MSVWGSCFQTLGKHSARVCRSCGSKYLALTPQASAPASAQRAAATRTRAQRKGSQPSIVPPPRNADIMKRLEKLQLNPEDEEDDFDDFDDFDETPASTPVTTKTQVPAEVQGELTEDGLPKSKGTKVRSAEYVSSSVTLDTCPKSKFPEIAVIGRSNVGKSSLINMLVGDRKLALTSKQPGKTKCINHFLINKDWWLVDLPGYGYAKQGKEDRLTWNTFTKEYFLEREALIMVMVLIDGSIPAQAIDLECINWLVDSAVPFTVVFTKVDKKKKKGPTCDQNIDSFLSMMDIAFEEMPDCFVTSASENLGRVPLMQFMSSLRQVFEAEQESSLVA